MHCSDWPHGLGLIDVGLGLARSFWPRPHTFWPRPWPHDTLASLTSLDFILTSFICTICTKCFLITQALCTTSTLTPSMAQSLQLYEAWSSHRRTRTRRGHSFAHRHPRAKKKNRWLVPGSMSLFKTSDTAEIWLMTAVQGGREIIITDSIQHPTAHNKYTL